MDIRPLAWGGNGGHLSSGEIDESLDRATEIADEADLAMDRPRSGCRQVHVFGPDRKRRFRQPVRHRHSVDRLAKYDCPSSAVGLDVEQVGRADKICNEAIGGPPINIDGAG